MVETVEDLDGVSLSYPVIVKPLDRSGSRGITKIESPDRKVLEEAIENAKNQGFDKHALVEEYATGQEYSVEYISYNGEHEFLALTHKYTTGAPHFIETGHMEPAPVDECTLDRVKKVVVHALNSLGIQYGASHSELKIAKDGTIKIIEIGGRMGGDCIGANLVELSTGYDFVGAVVDIAMGLKPESNKTKQSYAGVHFIFDKEDVKVLEELKKNNPEILVEEDVHEFSGEAVTDSGSRFGYFLFASDDKELINNYLPKK